jgi:iron complex transport system substrate-binding protein
MKRLLFFLLSSIALQSAAASLSVRDDAGNSVVLAQPARRVVTLAPYLTELVFAAGGGRRIAGTMMHSDYPPAARSIPLIGDSHQLDVERLIALKPDLLVVWSSGNSAHQLDAVRKLGIPVFHSEPRKLDDIADTLERLGQVLGTVPEARKSAIELRARLAALAAQYRNRPPVRVFYQISARPLYTLNGKHMVSDAIRLCGGENVFSHMTVLAPQVGIEDVLVANPEALVAGQAPGEQMDGLNIWRQYPVLQAVRRGNLFALDADLLNRSGPRIVEGVARLCEMLETVRRHRAAAR